NRDAHLVDALGSAGKDRGLVAQYLVEAGVADALQRLLGAEGWIEREGVRTRRLRYPASGRQPIAALGLAAPFEAHRRLRQEAQRDIVKRGDRAAFQLELDLADPFARFLAGRA